MKLLHRSAIYYSVLELFFVICDVGTCKCHGEEEDVEPGLLPEFVPVPDHGGDHRGVGEKHQQGNARGQPFLKRQPT